MLNSADGIIDFLLSFPADSQLLTPQLAVTSLWLFGSAQERQSLEDLNLNVNQHY